MEQSKTEVSSLSQLRVKELRANLQQLIDELKGSQGSREISLAITKIQEGKMWLGMQLGNLGGEDLNARKDAEELEQVDNSEPKTN